ncbi:MAG: imidazole glycerol phosphate synthase subunit HisH [Solobacterium sp.]|nr:imidazole glycerol phosphate synthase subunit HisH [Solobacterium sp.]
MIGIIDYGMGNLASVSNALKKLGEEWVISADAEGLKRCDRLILPGVGAFGDGMANITACGLLEPVTKMVEEGKPLLGICLGMQMIFESSEEKGFTEGFGFLKGRIIRLETDLPVPEIGWNNLEFTRENSLKERLSDNPHAYYVHSYYAGIMEEEDLVAYSMYGDIRVPGIVMHGNVMGTQFHPEKSGEDGLKILEYFVKEFAV